MKLRIEVFDYWHAGSGSGRGPSLDAEVVKTSAGLPYLPGRTLRGLLREAVQMAEECGESAVPAGSTTRLFGTWSDANGPDRKDGILRISDATLPAEFERWIASEPTGQRLASTLFRQLAATAIDSERGTAAPHTLRVREVSVPVEMFASIDGIVDEHSWRPVVLAALPFVRALGSSRRRGLGRVRVQEVTA